MSPGPEDSEGSIQLEEGDEDLDDFDIAGSEFRSINTAIDQLQAVLDSLETRNAGIHEELLELLRSNREIREALQEEDTDNEGSEESCQKEPSQKGTAEESGKHTTASDELSSLCDVQLRVEDKCDS